jgi:hypothetical protein
LALLKFVLFGLGLEFLFGLGLLVGVIFRKVLFAERECVLGVGVVELGLFCFFFAGTHNFAVAVDKGTFVRKADFFHHM